MVTLIRIHLKKSRYEEIIIIFKIKLIFGNFKTFSSFRFFLFRFLQSLSYFLVYIIIKLEYIIR